MRLLPWVAATALLLAGCAGSGDPASTDGPDPGPAVSDTTGAIAGLVMDESLSPIPGATVGTADGASVATTGPDGSFTLGNMEPGAHTVHAAALGYEAAGQSVDVTAGQTVEVRFLLTPLPTEEPFTELRTFTGLIECGFGTAALVGNCVPLQFLFDQIGQNPTGTRTVGKYDVTDPASVKGGVFEMKWTPSSAGGGQQLGLYVDEDGAGPTSGTNYAAKNGPTPVRIQVDEEPYSKIKPSKKIQTRTFLPGTTPPSYTLNQRFEVFGTHCYVLACPDDYTVIKDQ